MNDEEYREVKETAARERRTVAEWVRQALRARSSFMVRAKLEGVCEPALHRYPAGEIDDMLAEIVIFPSLVQPLGTMPGKELLRPVR